MTNNDWYEAGEQIRKLVQDAVDSKDFQELGDAISDAVNQTVDGLQSVLYQKTNRASADRIRRNMQQKRTAHSGQHMNQNSDSAAEKGRIYHPVKVKVPGEISGRIMKWVGFSMSGMFGLSLALIGLIGLGTGISMLIPSGLLAVLFGGSLCMALCGKQKVSLAKRFRRYTEIMGNRTYCLVEELASGVGESCRYVQKDLKKMIRQGFFKEGHLDKKESLLITDKETYQQYLTTQTEYERRERMKDFGGAKEDRQRADIQRENDSANTREKLSPQCRELIEEGERYIAHVHECNVKIPGEEMSAKLDRLELVITRIFREAEKDPGVVPDLKKMMSYYLPTTRKLLDAYCELDEQPIGGQNIENTKKEIEVALDTVNVAFENLLDSLFEEKAWDISSDISVLRTMFAQEGLTGNDFDQGGK